MEKEIHAKNLGPITDLTFRLPGYGINVLSAPNGMGKSILLEACQSAAKGTGAIPLRRGSEKGLLEGLGSRITISAKQTRHKGEFQVESLEGKFDLSKLVDPGIKTPKDADKCRVKALLSLTGAQGSEGLYITRDDWDADLFDSVVTVEAKKETDIVEQAAKIARDYHTEARTWEALGKEDDARALVCREALEGVDLEAETDPDVLVANYEAAVSKQGGLTFAKGKFDADKVKADEARAELARWDAADIGSSVEDVLNELDIAKATVRTTYEHIQNLEDEAAQLKGQLTLDKQRVTDFENHLTRTKNAAIRREACSKLVASFESKTCPTDEEIAAAKQAVQDAKLAIDIGATTRSARMRAGEAETFAKSAESRRERAEKLRQIAANVDTVLSDAIPPGPFRTRVVGSNVRLVVTHKRTGEEVFYHDLSHGERWDIGVIFVADRLGEGGLIHLPQEAYESLDVWNRQTIHNLLVARKLYMLTLMASRDPDDPKDGFVMRNLEDTDREVEEELEGEVVE